MNKLTAKKIIAIVTSLIMYIIAPRGVDVFFQSASAIMFFLMAIDCIKSDIKAGVSLSFNLLFYPILFICTYVYPLFIYNTEIEIYFGFHSGYVDEYGNIATALVQLAVSCYYITERNDIRINKANLSTATNLIPCLAVVDLLALACFLIQFMSYLKGSQDTNDLADSYLGTISESFIYLSIILRAIDYHSKYQNRSLKLFIRKNLSTIGILMFIVLGCLYIGDRTVPIFFSCFLLAIISFYVYEIRIKYLLIFFPIVGLFMYTIGQTRSDSNVSIKDNGMSAYVDATDVIVSNTKSVLIYFSDYTPSTITLTRSLYLIDNNNSYYYPGKVFVVLASPIPLLPTVLTNLLYDLPRSEISSAAIITKQYRKAVELGDSGMGTHAVGDLYLSWGLLGVIIGFLVLGKIMSYSKSHLDSLFQNIIYFTMLSYALYIPRDTLYLGIRTIFYQFIIYLLLKSIRK